MGRHWPAPTGLSAESPTWHAPLPSRVGAGWEASYRASQWVGRQPVPLRTCGKA